MSERVESDDYLDGADGAIASRLESARPLPSGDFRGALHRHLAARDPGHGQRPEHLRRSAALYIAGGGALAAVGLLQALGVL
jgi:hypothetical protein